jgi:hypothetical protein
MVLECLLHEVYQNVEGRKVIDPVLEGKLKEMVAFRDRGVLTSVLTGMRVSVVTDEAYGTRFSGVVDVVQEDSRGKYGLTLLAQEAESNEVTCAQP